MVDDDEHWLCGATLAECALPDEGVLVLSVERADGTFLGAPRSSTEVRLHDRLVLYGSTESLTLLAGRHRRDDASRLVAEAKHFGQLVEQDEDDS